MSRENLKSLSYKRHLRAVFVFFNFNITLVIKITYTLLVLASYWKIKLQKSPKCHKNYVPEPKQNIFSKSFACLFFVISSAISVYEHRCHHTRTKYKIHGKNRPPFQNFLILRILLSCLNDLIWLKVYNVMPILIILIHKDFIKYLQA